MQGEVVYLYAFDVANEIDTGRIREILANKPTPFEIRPDRALPKDVPLYKPLAIESPSLATCFGGRPARVLVRVYDIGVVSIIMRVPFEVETLHELLPYHKPALADGRTFDQAARELSAQTCQSLHDVMVRRAAPSEPEAYTVFCLTDLGGACDTTQWLAEQGRSVAELLAESEPETLSEAYVNEILRIRRSFERTDAVVIDWDAALTIDLTGYVDDVLYVIELANLQLEEYRVMDQRLDGYLNRAYDDLRRRRLGIFWAYSAVLRALRLFSVDAAKLNDEVTHISKFFGDWYLARVYLGASERFYLDHWRTSVEDRLKRVDELYSVVNSDIANQRILWLEIVMAIFFAIDLFAILVLKR